MSSGFSIIVEISRFIELKISKRYMMLYKENMVNEDIKRAYVRWTHTEL
jgi:hypothetical protein